MTVRTWPRRATLAAFAAFAVLAAPGCGSGNVALTGDVTYDNQPIDDGTITFVSASGGSSDAGKASCHIENGKYKFEKDRGPAPGKYKVEITWLKKTGKKTSTGDGPEMRDEKAQALPAKFNTQSTLTADVSSGSPKLDFALRSTQ